jgi:hypothetical protein
MTASRSLFPVEIQGGEFRSPAEHASISAPAARAPKPLTLPQPRERLKNRDCAFITAPVAGLAISNSEERSAKVSFAATGRPPSPYEGVGMSLPHAQASRRASGTSSAIRRSSRTNNRHQHFSFAARNRLVACYNAQSSSSRRTGRPRFTLRSRRTHWAGRTWIALWSGWPGGSVFARRSRLTLRPLRAGTGGQRQAQHGDNCGRGFHSFLPLS